MIAGVRGTLEAVGDSWVVVAVGGVSLRVAVPNTVIPTLGGIGGPVRLHTHLVVREEELSLYGFPTTEALRLFQTLLTVSGVGPRLALSLLNSASPEALAVAIASGDAARLQRAQGVGRKIAERVVLELREKFSGVRASAPGAAPDEGEDEATAALTSLGYTPAEAQNVLRRTPVTAGEPLEERVRRALQHLAAR
jgi:Holliday junction DNA helicase RuvA